MLDKMQKFLQQEKHYIMLESAVLGLLLIWLSSLLGTCSRLSGIC
jgi:hypothetical protein